MSSEHLTVDGTLIEAWAGHGRALNIPRMGRPLPPPRMVEVAWTFAASKRTNDTHESTSDPEAKSARKGKGKEAELVFWRPCTHGEP